MKNFRKFRPELLSTSINILPKTQSSQKSQTNVALQLPLGLQGLENPCQDEIKAHTQYQARPQWPLIAMYQALEHLPPEYSKMKTKFPTQMLASQTMAKPFTYYGLDFAGGRVLRRG